MFHAILVGADVLGSIDPLFLSVAFLDVVFELSFVLASIDVSVLAVAVRHVVLELASVDVALGVPEGSLALCLVVAPLTFVVSSIGPVLDSVPVPDYGRNVIFAGVLLILVALAHHLINVLGSR